MSALSDRYDSLAGKGRATERLEFFSDAVFAIAMTLLVIDLAVPDDASGTAGQVLLDQLPNFLAYGLSFAIIAVNWTGHHRKFRLIREYDSRLVTLNLVLLFLVAFVPFPTSLLAHYAPDRAAVILYAATVALMSTMQFALWSYAYRHKLLDEGVDLPIYRFVRRDILVVPIVFAVTILIAIFWDSTIAMYSWFAIWPASVIVNRYDPTATVAKT